MKPMKLGEVPLSMVDKLIADDEWVLEQKLDGTRAMVLAEMQPDGHFSFLWLASGGGQLKFAAAVQHLPAIERRLDHELFGSGVLVAVLDGELMVADGVYQLFDLPVLNLTEQHGPVICHHGTDEPYAVRRLKLTELISPSEQVQHVPSAVGAENKRRLWERLVEAGAEGAVAKRADSRYLPGQRTMRQLKLKLTKTADVVVTGIEDWTHRTGKASLGVPISLEQDSWPWVDPKGRRYGNEEYDGLSPRKAATLEYAPRTMLPVGNASLIGKDRSIEVGSVVEVEYLYWTGTAMVQPRIVRLRRPEEKTPAECRLDQFPAYSREVVR